MIPIVSERMICVSSHGPEYLIVGGVPGGSCGPFGTRKVDSCIKTSSTYDCQYERVIANAVGFWPWNKHRQNTAWNRKGKAFKSCACLYSVYFSFFLSKSLL